MEQTPDNPTPISETIPAPQPVSSLPNTVGMAMGTVLCGLLFCGAFWFGSFAAIRTTIADKAETQTAAVQHAFDSISIIGRAAYVYDGKTGKVLYAKNPDAQLPLASLTKLMTALVATQTLAPDTPVTITAPALAMDGDTGFKLGEVWRLHDLIDATLVPSSNDGAEAIALAMGSSLRAALTAMNNEAQTLGMTHTYFLNPTGLDESSTMSGAYGSAGDYARLLAYIVQKYPDMLDGTTKDSIALTSLSGTAHTFANTDLTLGQIPGLIGGKTGYTDLAGGNLAVAFDADIGHPIIVVVLGSTEDGRFADVRTLVNAVRETLQ